MHLYNTKLKQANCESNKLDIAKKKKSMKIEKILNTSLAKSSWKIKIRQKLALPPTKLWLPSKISSLCHPPSKISSRTNPTAFTRITSGRPSKWHSLGQNLANMIYRRDLHHSSASDKVNNEIWMDCNLLRRGRRRRQLKRLHRRWPRFTFWEHKFCNVIIHFHPPDRAAAAAVRPVGLSSSWGGKFWSQL